jgi:tryptophanyl-tRNA synthetase
VVEYLRPIQQRYAELSADPEAMRAVLAKGAEKAIAVSTPVLLRAREAIGLLPR